jgi:polyhydroxybutyrate depolymerase
MKLIFTLLLFSTLCSAQQTIYDTITHGGLQRDFILYVPASYTVSTSVPLLFNYHGYTSNAGQQLWYGDFKSIADTAGFIIVHPQGTLDASNTTHFNVGWAGGAGVDDIGFSEALIDSISSLYNIDPNRVYCTGMSNGGYMSYHMACLLNHKIAAIASVTGTMSPYTYNNCNPIHPTPVLQIHGTNDGTVPYSGSSFGEPIDSVMKYWANFNNCDPIGDTTFLPDLVPTDGSTVSHIVYDSGHCNISTELLRVAGGGHTWPGSIINLSGTNYDINASLKVWQFLSKYRLDDLYCITNIVLTQNETPELKIYPVPANSNLYIEHNSAITIQYQIISSLGILLKTGTLESTTNEINIRDLTPGIYYLKTDKNIYRIVKL